MCLSVAANVISFSVSSETNLKKADNKESFPVKKKTVSIMAWTRKGERLSMKELIMSSTSTAREKMLLLAAPASIDN